MNNKNLTILLLAQSAFCGLMILGRNFLLDWPPNMWAIPVKLTGWSAPPFLFLAWNLFLAWIPFGLASRLTNASSKLTRISLLLLWLLFFPNAPYIITDLIHLKSTPLLPMWYDALLLFVAAWTGLMLGYCSLLQTKYMLQQWWGRRFAHTFSMLALLLCGFGIYLGRFLRWNSWDVLVQPLSLVESLLQLLFHPPNLLYALAISALMSCVLALGYFTIYTISKSDIK